MKSKRNSKSLYQVAEIYTKMTKEEKAAIEMLKQGQSITTVAMKTGFSAFWLSMKMNEVKI